MNTLKDTSKKGSSGELAGTGLLLRLMLRQERIIMPVWITILVLIAVGYAINFQRVLPDELSRQNFMAELIQNPVALAFNGQVVGTSIGALAVWRIGDTLYVILALMLILTVLRHTRAEEEAGRQELLRAGMLGRYAPLTASLIVAWGASLLTGMLVTLGLLALGLERAGSIAFGLAAIGLGWIYTALAALVAQLTESTRADRMIGILILGGFYLIRFVADGSNLPWLKWFSPNGWAHLVEPFGNERWWIIGLLLVVAIGIAGGAYWLMAHRDAGSGILPVRSGPAGSSTLRGPIVLAWRLHRSLLLGWAVGYTILGIALGSMASIVPGILEDGMVVQEFISRYSGSPNASFTDVYLELIIISMGMTLAFYSALATLRLRAEEAAGHGELVLSTAVGRLHWVASHLVLSLLGTTVVMGAGGGGFGLVHALSSGNLSEFPRILGGALLHVPAAWVLTGFAVFLFGALPRLAVAITWVVVVGVQIVGEILGPIFLGSAYNYHVVNALQPFHWVPKVVSGGEVSGTALLGLLAFAVLFSALGLVLFQRRDVG